MYLWKNFLKVLIKNKLPDNNLAWKITHHAKSYVHIHPAFNTCNGIQLVKASFILNMKINFYTMNVKLWKTWVIVCQATVGSNSVVYLSLILIYSITCTYTHKIYQLKKMGAQWLSGKVLDSRPRGCGFKPHRRSSPWARNIYPSLVLVQPGRSIPI